MSYKTASMLHRFRHTCMTGNHVAVCVDLSYETFDIAPFFRLPALSSDLHECNQVFLPHVIRCVQEITGRKLKTELLNNPKKKGKK